MDNREKEVLELINNSEGVAKEENTEQKNTAPSKGIFKKFAVKDIVFLAIMAACMLVTGAVMPLVVHIPVFGIIQLCLALQFSIFPTIGLMKTRKVGSILLISLFCGIFFAFMYLPMFICIMICAVIAEMVNIIIFRGYEKDVAILVSGTIYFPLTLPMLYVYYNYLYTFTGEEGEAVNAFIGADAGFVIGIVIAVIAITFVGAFAGTKISKELIKVGVMKK